MDEEDRITFAQSLRQGVKDVLGCFTPFLSILSYGMGGAMSVALICVLLQSALSSTAVRLLDKAMSVPLSPPDGWLTPCAPGHPLAPVLPNYFCKDDLAQRYHIAISTQHALTNMSDIVDWVVKTPSAQSFSLKSRAAHTVHRAILHGSDLQDKEAISQIFLEIAQRSHDFVQVAINIAFLSQSMVTRLVGGFEEILLMFEKRSTYSSEALRDRYDKQMIMTDNDMRNMERNLIDAQIKITSLIRLHESGSAKLAAMQKTMRVSQAEYEDANTFSLRGWWSSWLFDANASEMQLTNVQYTLLMNDLRICSAAATELADLERFLDDYLLFLRNYRAHIYTKSQDFNTYIWTSGDLTLDDRIFSLGQMIQPAKEQLARLK